MRSSAHGGLSRADGLLKEEKWVRIKMNGVGGESGLRTN